jgi:serine-type D-Ala-D-Ala carboxypeptidase/endopeptidase
VAPDLVVRQAANIAFAPTRNAAEFISINKFDFAAGIEMGDFANDLLANIAPR